MKFAGIKAEVLALWGVCAGVVASIMECSASSPMADWCTAIALGFAVAAAAYILFLSDMKDKDE